MKASRKKFLIVTIIIFCLNILYPLLWRGAGGEAFSQNVGIGASSFTPDAQAMLEIQSTTSGLLIPRMTAAQRTAIAAGASSDYGLLVYQTDGTAGYYYWTGAAWVQLATSANGWSLTGNASTNPASNYLGTSDAVDLVFRTSATERFRVSSTGKLGINVAPNASYQLYIYDNTNNARTIYSVTDGRNAYAIFGENTFCCDAGEHYGVYGLASGSNGDGHYGVSGRATGNNNTQNIGGYFIASGTGNAEAYGGYFIASGAGVNTAGVLAGTSENGGKGVDGYNSSTGTGSQYGVIGRKQGNTGTGTGYGVYGSGTGTGTTNYGLYGTATGATNNYGTYGVTTTGGNTSFGIYGVNNSTTAGVAHIAIKGETTTSCTGGTGYGVYANAAGTSASSNYGVYSVASGAPTNAYGVYGDAGTASNSYGVYGRTTGTGSANYGLYGAKTGNAGANTGYGVYGTATGTAANNYGGYFTASGGTANYAIYGTTSANGGYGVYGANTANVFGTQYGIYGIATTGAGGGTTYGVFGKGGTSGTQNYGVHGEATGATGTNLNYGLFGYATGASTNNYGVQGGAAGTNPIGVNATVSGSSNGSGITASNACTGAGSQYGVYAAKTGATGTGTGYGVFGTATGTGANNYGLYGTASGASNNYAIYGTTAADGGYGGYFSNTSTAFGSQYGVYGAKTGDDGGVNAAIGYGVYGTATGGGSENYGLYGTASGLTDKNYAVYGTAGGASDRNYGGYFEAVGGTYNYGIYVAGGETKITDAAAAVPTRNDNGSIATSTNGGNRIYYRTGGTNYYVNSDGAGDYSEYFRNNDPTLAIGEIVCITPANHNAVEKANYNTDGDVRMVGVVSKYGTRNNDNNDGQRYADNAFVNIGLLGQLQVKVSEENGPIKPGDALALSTTQPGVAVKAIEEGKIIGYAMTHYPYVEGEITYPTHTGTKGEADILEYPHVMAFIQPSYYKPKKNIVKQ